MRPVAQAFAIRDAETTSPHATELFPYRGALACRAAYGRGGCKARASRPRCRRRPALRRRQVHGLGARLAFALVVIFTAHASAGVQDTRPANSGSCYQGRVPTKRWHLASRPLLW